VEEEEDKCEICGCTERKACEGGCWWISKTLCSTCYKKILEDYAIRHRHIANDITEVKQYEYSVSKENEKAQD